MTHELGQISVIMASYNAAQYIGEAIASILEQTYPHRD
ncbi:glycosyltransferase [Spirulina subsalsa]|nr:glycosyltransferase [Spirulina subsalsa]